MLECHIGQCFDRRDTRSTKLLDQPFPESRDVLERSRRLWSHRGHLLLYFLALLFFALDVDLPAEKLGGEAHVLAFLADGERELGVVDDNFELLVGQVGDGNAADLGRL